MSRRCGACFIVLLMMLLATGNAAHAATVQFALSVTVVQDGDGLLPGIAEGDIATGIMGFDLNVTPFMQTATQSLYSDAFTGFSFSLNSQIIFLESIESPIVGVTNGAQDLLTVDHVVSSAPLGDFRARALTLRFADLEGSTFNSADLPTTLNVTDFEIRFISVELFSPSNGPVALVFEVDSIQAVQVPVPAAVWLLSSGLILLRLATGRTR